MADHIENTEFYIHDDAESHTDKLLQWETIQSQVRVAMETPYSGMIATADVHKGFVAHKRHLQQAGYDFGNYAYDRSMFERLDREVLFLTPPEAMGQVVFNEAKSMLKQINQEAKPKRGEIARFAFTKTTYVPPMAKLIHLLAHPLAVADDLDSFWEITDRLWCFGHPIYYLHNARLDYTCNKIIKRLADLESEVATKRDP